MKTNIFRKFFLLVLVEILSLVCLFALFLNMQTMLSTGNYKSELTEALTGLKEKNAEEKEDYAEAASSYDEANQSKAAAFAYMANNLPDFSYTKIKQYRELLGVTNALIIDTKGDVLAKAEKTDVDFSANRFNQLMEAVESDEPSEPFSVESEDGKFRYYGCAIDRETIAVVVTDGADLDEIKENNYSWESLLQYDTIGKDGFVFAVSDQDYTFLYFPDTVMDVEDMDALEAGIEAEFLSSGETAWISVMEEQYYAASVHASEENAYIVSAVPRAEILASRNITVGLVLFAFLTVITIIVTYGIFLLLAKRAEEDDPDSDRDDKEDVSFASGEENTGIRLRFNKEIAVKLAAVMLIGVVAIAAASWYMQSLFDLSSSSANNEAYISDIKEELELTEENVEDLTKEYEDRYLCKAKIAAYIFSHAPELVTNDELVEVADMLGVEYLAVFDENGTTKANSDCAAPFTLSTEEGDQSYEFRKLLNGSMYVVQEAMENEVAGDFVQYTGYAMVSDDGALEGFVQICASAEKLESMIDNASVESVLRNVKAGATGFAFAVSAESGEIVYYPDEDKIGLDYAELGVTEASLSDGFNGYLTLENEGYYCSTAKCGENYIFTAIPSSDIGSGAPLIAACSAVASLVFLLIVFLILCVDIVPAGKNDTSRDMTDGISEMKGETESGSEGDEDDDLGERNINVEMPDGRTIRTESIISRWAGTSMSWKEKTPEQRLGGVLQGFLIVLAIIVCVLVLFKDSFFGESSAFMYILKGKWEHEFNLFSVTACLMIVCVVYVVTIILRKLLQTVSNALDARGETICRLISSFIKYISVIAVLYYCLAMFGVDTAALLASAGILALVIGLGAQSLIQDILAGLFIIFEGEFRVGDIVTIDGFRGTVLEIGIRNTKIQDGSNNIKLISNRNVSGVLNMTKKFSVASCDVGIGYSESLERVESIMSGELANIREHIPEIDNGPFYKGVVSLEDSSVIIRIVAECKESDRDLVQRSLTREMKLILDKYDIEIPFPQIVVNKPVEKKKATALEKKTAEAFNEEQEKLSEGLNKSEFDG